jgi:hypothetical protein
MRRSTWTDAVAFVAAVVVGAIFFQQFAEAIVLEATLR